MNIEPKHDFTLKLRQGMLLPRVMDYVKWQRAVKKAEASGEALPVIPQNIGLISINLDLTTACNYACAHCIDWDIINSGVKYEYDKLIQSLSNLIARGLRSVILIGGGESTLHPKFTEVVRFLKERHLQVAIVYNGSRSDRVHEIAEILTKGDWIRLSLDAGTDRTFQLAHRPKQPVKLEEICSWIPKIRSQNPTLPIGFSFVVVWEGGSRSQIEKAVPNIDEIILAAKLARDSGFSYISYKPFLTRFPDGAEVMDPQEMANIQSTLQRITNDILLARDFETQGFKVIESTNLRALMNGSWKDFTYQTRICHLTAFRQVFSPLGVFHCPTHRGVPKAKVGPATIWSDPNQVANDQNLVAQKLKNFNAALECREITCLYHGANHWIQNLIDTVDLETESTTLLDKEDCFL